MVRLGLVQAARILLGDDERGLAAVISKSEREMATLDSFSYSD